MTVRAIGASLCTMRFDGTLRFWNHDKGHGFIAPRHGGPVTFVHVCAFPHDGLPPRLGEPLTFELEVDSHGNKRAVDVRRPRRAPLAPARRPLRRPLHSVRKVIGGACALVLVAGAGMLAYAEWSRRTVPAHTVAAVKPTAALAGVPVPASAERPGRR